jgi:hypothetical protein
MVFKKKDNEASKAKAVNEVTVKARSGNPAVRGEVIQEAKQAMRTPEPIKLSKHGLNAAWLVPTMVGTMLIGISWIVIFYLTASNGGYPMPVLRYGNLVVGFVFILAGFGLSTKWK